MASSLIHMCVANEVNKVLGRKKEDILIGSIAPDIAKLLGKSKLESHFLDTVENDVPNMDKFMEKYKKDLNNDFVLGYYIHLYTDYLWFKYFYPEITDRLTIRRLNGEVLTLPKEKIKEYLYTDYTNLNKDLIDIYNLDLKIFYNEVPKFQNIIKEIPMDKISLIIDKAGIIIEETKKKKAFSFDMNNIKQFIKFSTDLIISNLNDLNIESKNDIHEMKLQEKYFNMIRDDIKHIEYRLNDPKRQKVKVGDSIIFTKMNSDEKIVVEVVGLKKYKDLYDMYEDTFDDYLYNEYSDVAAVVKDTTFYTEEEISKYGTLAIFIKK